jgi:hypothetical protein
VRRVSHRHHRSERFALRPRAVARMRALRDSLLRRGWREL